MIRYKFTYILSLLNLPPTRSPSPPTPLGQHRAPSWAPCVTQQLFNLLSVLYMVMYMSILLSQFTPHELDHPGRWTQMFMNFGSTLLFMFFMVCCGGWGEVETCILLLPHTQLLSTPEHLKLISPSARELRSKYLRALSPTSLRSGLKLQDLGDISFAHLSPFFPSHTLILLTWFIFFLSTLHVLTL